MNTFTDNLLSTIDRITGRFSPASLLIDRVAESIAPKVAAQAACYSGTFCYVICSESCSPDFSEEYVAYSPRGNCGQPYVCYNGCHCG